MFFITKKQKLMWAIKQQNLALVKTLLNLGVSPIKRYFWQSCSLSQAVFESSTEIVELILKYVYINYPNYLKNNPRPLLTAMYHDEAKKLELLLQCGADISPIWERSWFQRSSEIIEVILKYATNIPEQERSMAIEILNYRKRSSKTDNKKL